MVAFAADTAGIDRIESGLDAFSLGQQLFEQEGQAAEAERALREATASGNRDAPRFLGVLLMNRGELSEAEEMYQIGVTRGDYGAAFNLGRLLHDQTGREADAEQAYRAAIAFGSLDALNNLAALIQDQPGRAGEAARTLAARIECQPYEGSS